MYINMAINPGNSGGAILASDGKVRAVVKEKYISGYDQLDADLSCLEGVQGIMQLTAGDHNVDVGSVIRRAIKFTRDASQLVMGVGISASVAKAYLQVVLSAEA